MKKQNLSEEIYRMRKLMNFDSKEYIENTTSFDTLVEESFIKEKINNSFLLTEEDDFDWEKDLLLMEQEEQNQEQTEEDNVFEEIPDEDIINTPEFEEFAKSIAEEGLTGEEFTKDNIEKLKGKTVIFTAEDGSFAIGKFDPKGMVAPPNSDDIIDNTSGDTESKQINEGRKKGPGYEFWTEEGIKDYWKTTWCLGRKGENTPCILRGGGEFTWGLFDPKSSRWEVFKCSSKSNKFCWVINKILAWVWRRIVDTIGLRFPIMVGSSGILLFIKLIKALYNGGANMMKWLKKKFKKWFKKKPKRYKRFIKTWVDVKGKGSFQGSRLRIGVKRYWTIGQGTVKKEGNEVYLKKVDSEDGKITVPEEEWDDYIEKNEKFLIQKMNSASRKNWKKLREEPDNPKDKREDGYKQYVVYVIQKYLEGLKKYKWKYVVVGDLTWMKDVDNPGEEEPGENEAYILSIPQGDEKVQLFPDNKYEIADAKVLQDGVIALTKTIKARLDEMAATKWNGGWRGYISKIEIESSASRFRNNVKPKNMTFEELAKARMENTKNYIMENLEVLKPDGLVIDNSTQINLNWEGENGDGTSGPNPPDRNTKYLVVKDIESGQKSGTDKWVTVDVLKKNENFMKFYKKTYFNPDGTLNKKYNKRLTGGTWTLSSGRINVNKDNVDKGYFFVPKGKDMPMENYCSGSVKSNGTPKLDCKRNEFGQPHGSKEEYNKYKYTKINITVVYNGIREIPPKPQKENGTLETITGGDYPVSFATPPKYKGQITIPIPDAELKIKLKKLKPLSPIVGQKPKGKTNVCPEAYGNKISR